MPADAPLEGPANVEAWARVFADIEAQLGQIGPDLGEPELEQLRSWAPPADLGPLPDGLREYAAALLLDLRSAITALEADMAANRQQSRVADSVPPSRERGLSGYLDVQA